MQPSVAMDLMKRALQIVDPGAATVDRQDQPQHQVEGEWEEEEDAGERPHDAHDGDIDAEGAGDSAGDAGDQLVAAGTGELLLHDVFLSIKLSGSVC